MSELMTHPDHANGAATLEHLMHSDPETSGGPGIVGILLNRWKLLTVAAILSGVVGFLVGERFCLKTWQAEGTLLYSPYPVPDTLRGVYTPPSSQTLITLVKSPTNLEKLRKEFELEVPIKSLDKLFKVTQPQNAEMMTVTLDWAEPETGAALVNRLMELHIAHVAELRKTRVADSLRNLEDGRDRAREKLVKARKEYDAFEARVNVYNIASEVDRLEREATSLEQSLAIPRSNLRVVLAQQAKIDEYMDGLHTGSSSATEPPESGTGGDRPIQSRRTALRDLIQTTEFKYSESNKEYEAKLQEYNTLKANARLRIVTKSELEKARLDLDLARTRRDNNLSAIQKFKDEMKLLPMTFAQSRRTELKEQIASIKTDIVNIEKSVAEKRKQAREMSLLLKQAEPMTKTIKEAEDETTQIEAQLVALKRMNKQESNEFVIETPAVPMTHATASNRKKLTLAAFSLPMLLLIGLVIVHDRRTALTQYLEDLKAR